jgi:hypothetical protein
MDDIKFSQNSALVELQKYFCLINLNGEYRILDRLEVENILLSKSSGEISFYKKQDGELSMRRYLENLSIPCEVGKTIKDFWSSPNTHLYKSIAFSPKEKSSDVLNYWVGSTINPEQGDWDSLKEFLFIVICNGHEETFKYIYFYLAHMLQKPDDKPGIMIVMLGQQGVGKGLFFSLLRSIWSKSTLQVSDVENVLGNFNSQLERNYVVCMDEALFSGDRKSMERLKSLITERVCRIEQKYQPARTIESCHRFFAASNGDHFANIERDDRRFLVLRVSSIKQGDAKYFEKLFQTINDESNLGAMVYDLMNLDISKFDVRKRPKTKEHTEQVLQSLSGFDRYWFHVLQIGSFDSKSPKSFVWSEPLFIASKFLAEYYLEFNKNAERYSPFQPHVIKKTMEKFCISSKQDRRQEDNLQERGWSLPSITIARQEFEKAIGNPVDWG